MRAVLVVAMGIALAGTCAAQVYTSPPPVCFAFNDTNWQGTLPTVAIPCSGSLTVGFVAPSTSSVSRLDIAAPGGALLPIGVPLLVATIYQTPTLGGAPSGPAIGTFSAPFSLSIDGWHALLAATPVAFTAGGTYAVVVRATPAPTGTCATTCIPIDFNPIGTSPLPYQWTATSCAASIPPSGTMGMIMRFRDLSCAPGPLASVGPIGSSCGDPSGVAVLQSITPPMLGSVWSGLLTGTPGAPAALFWSIGVDQTGTTIPGSTCLVYLDAVSLGSLNATGLEPLAIATIPASGMLTWNGLVPSSPSVAGVVIGVQCLIIDPAGTLPLGGGLAGEVTNGLILTLGY